MGSAKKDQAKGPVRNVFEFPVAASISDFESSLEKQQRQFQDITMIEEKCVLSTELLAATIDKAIAERDFSLLDAILSSDQTVSTPGIIQRLVSSQMTFAAINVAIRLSRKAQLTSADLLRILVFILDGPNAKMTEMLKCLPSFDPVFLEIQLPADTIPADNEVMIRILLALLLETLPPIDDLKSALLSPPVVITNACLFSLLSELLHLTHKKNAVLFISALVDSFYVRMCMADDFAPLLIQIRNLIETEIKVVDCCVAINSKLSSMASAKNTPPPKKHTTNAGYSKEPFEWRLMSRLLISNK